MKKINLTKNENCFNIWRYADLYADNINPDFRLTLEEGWTKEVNLSRLAKSLGIKKLWIKRDDLNPTGSHKARSLAYQVSKYFQKNHKNLLISSSGNAACAGAAYAKLADINFFAFISPETEKNKINLMRKFGANIIITPKPINLSNYISRIYNIPNLRPSIDDSSLEGYKSIAFELTEKGIFPDAIFLCPTSASTLVGIGRGYQYLERKFGIKSPQIHAVQYGDVTSLVEKAEGRRQKVENRNQKNQKYEKRLGIKHTPREKEALSIINKTQGSGWQVFQDEIIETSLLLSNSGIVTSYEGTAAIAGLIKAFKTNKNDFHEPLCLFTGHYSQWEDISNTTASSINHIDNYLEAKNLFKKIV